VRTYTLIVGVRRRSQSIEVAMKDGNAIGRTRSLAGPHNDKSQGRNVAPPRRLRKAALKGFSCAVSPDEHGASSYDQIPASFI